jgi:hypothetical protein
MMNISVGGLPGFWSAADFLAAAYPFAYVNQSGCRDEIITLRWHRIEPHFRFWRVGPRKRRFVEIPLSESEGNASRPQRGRTFRVQI